MTGLSDSNPDKRQDGEPLPRPFGVVWEAFWKQRRERGERWLPSLVRSFFDTRAVNR
jgi:hypothetical protein